ncbi:integrator complex subunit 11 [Pancytospora philotis]|nr:integrator complex subunit 11 [Pancytospora philotis]
MHFFRCRAGPMEVVALGSGQEIGRSCVVVHIEGRTVMFDCGMHMGYADERKFPDFSYLSRVGDINSVLDCVIISHFHLDHCGALPYLTEVLGYHGPIYMTYPTRAVLEILLEDCQRILQMKNQDGKIYTSDDIKRCIERVTPVNMNETVEVGEDFVITPYYAGHVIGAAMFHVRIASKSVVYTGDFSTQSDRHLASAWIDRLCPDLMITESTYGSVVRDCRKSKERKFLQLIHSCLKRNGKVLIPIFALGRAQELCLLIDAYWERMGLQAPVYLAGGMTGKANEIYKRFINYTKASLKEQVLSHNAFEFKHIRQYEKNAELGEPCVIFASPAMLFAGLSLKIFKNMCGDPRNLVILPGYCVRGTVGDRVLSGNKEIEIFGQKMKINIQVENLAFSAHADTMGIMKILEQCQPRQVMLVHGEKSRMEILRKAIRKKLGVPVHTPANGVLLPITTNETVQVRVPTEMLREHVDFCSSSQPINLVMRLKRDRDGITAVECKEFLVEEKGDEAASETL